MENSVDYWVEEYKKLVKEQFDYLKSHGHKDPNRLEKIDNFQLQIPKELKLDVLDVVSNINWGENKNV